jgi:hypothetical protein
MKQLLIILFLLTSIIAYGQIDSIPLALTKKYFNGEIRNYKSVLIGEAKDQNFNPKKIFEEADIEFETLMLKKDKAVIAVSLSERDQHTDIYSFWTKGEDWQITAFRALWLPGVFYMYFDRFRNLDDEGIKTEYQKMFEEVEQNNDTLTDKQITEQIGTLEDLQTYVSNTKLTVESDKNLKKYFYKNQDKFHALLNKIQNDSITKTKVWRIKKQPNYKEDLRELLLSGVSGYDGHSLIDFYIGGMIDNSVGYFYCKNPVDVPEMSDNRYIMIRNLGNGWYLYKTT